jgi:hypothetical protein
MPKAAITRLDLGIANQSLLDCLTHRHKIAIMPTIVMHGKHNASRLRGQSSSCFIDGDDHRLLNDDILPALKATLIAEVGRYYWRDDRHQIDIFVGQVRRHR